jgi:alpha-ketoglutarate-dependent taurine dioxygenase
MSPVSFEVVGSRVEPYAATPTLVLRLRITAADGAPIHALVLRCQIMIQPKQRHYSPEEERRLVELFGDTPRWGDTLQPFLWTNVSTTVTTFSGATEVDLHIPCTYDMDVAAAKYLHSLDHGEIPILAMFSGTAFSRGAAGFSAAPVAWSEEAAYRLPVTQWREMMDAYFPNSGWLRVRRETLDALQRFKVRRALLTWDEAFEQLLKQSGEDV